MSLSADRKPSLIAWSDQFRLDMASVDKNFTEAGATLVKLLPLPYEKYPSTFTVQRGKDVYMVPGAAAAFRRARIALIANHEEVASAPEDMQKLFIDLGVSEGDEIAVGLIIAKRRPKADSREFAEIVYAVSLVPTVFREDLLGIEFNYAQQLGFLKPGTSLDHTEPADLWHGSERVRKIRDAYALLMEGTVYDSYAEGTHTAIIRYRHKPHAYIALIHRSTAEWISNLVESKITK